MADVPKADKMMSKMRCYGLLHEQGNNGDLITVVAASGIKLAVPICRLLYGTREVITAL